MKTPYASLLGGLVVGPVAMVAIIHDPRYSLAERTLLGLVAAIVILLGVIVPWDVAKELGKRGEG